jgi:dTMP kinase
MRKSQNKGLFITIEKTREGLGGTTLSQNLHEQLNRAGMETVLTKEPGGTPVGQKLRELLLSTEWELSNAARLFIQMADRSQHYKEVLKPALKEGKIVVSDRYFDSTLVYQGSAAGWKTAFLLRLHQAATGMLLPDLTIVLDGTPYRELGNDALEGKGEEFHRKVHDGMLYFASKSDRYVIVNTNQSEETVTSEVLRIVKERFPERFNGLLP